MQRIATIVSVSVALLLGLDARVYSFNAETHRAITKEAVNRGAVGSYVKRMGFPGGLNTQLTLPLFWKQGRKDYADLLARHVDPGWQRRTILEWMELGGVVEDCLWLGRNRHHFYDPIRNAGLDNWSDYPGYRSWTRLGALGSFNHTGESSLVWATRGTSTMNPRFNYSTWMAARLNFLWALRLPTKALREETLALGCIELACVMHLLADAGVPAHTRNDFLFGHYRSRRDRGNPFEDYVERRIRQNRGNIPGTGPLGWLNNWTPQPLVFDAVAHYWDTDSYMGQYFEGYPPPEGILGLAECTNYQFLSFSTVFGCWGVKYQFPHPFFWNMGYDLVEDSYTYFNGYPGYKVGHMAQLSYLDHFTHPDYHIIVPGYTTYLTNTTDDVAVQEDYAKITIPRTIDYVTGLANYFFRGRLKVQLVAATGGLVAIDIINVSSNSGVPQVLSGGIFELYADDDSGNRTRVDSLLVPGWSFETSTLGYEQAVEATFIPPAAKTKYTLIYVGQINPAWNPTVTDRDDLWAIAVGGTPGVVCMGWINEANGWYRPGLKERDRYNADLAEYRNLANQCFIRSGCRFPETGSMENILPEGYSPPDEISVESYPVTSTLDDMTDDFHEICDGTIPQYLLLYLDKSGSVPYHVPYGAFVDWVGTNYPAVVIDVRETTDENWIGQWNSMLDDIVN